MAKVHIGLDAKLIEQVRQEAGPTTEEVEAFVEAAVRERLRARR